MRLESLLDPLYLIGAVWSLAGGVAFVIAMLLMSRASYSLF